MEKQEETGNRFKKQYCIGSEKQKLKASSKLPKYEVYEGKLDRLILKIKFKSKNIQMNFIESYVMHTKLIV